MQDASSFEPARASKEDSLGLRLSELVDELGMDEMDDGAEIAAPSDADLISAVPSKEGDRAAAAFTACARDNGFSAFLDALAFCGLREELPRFFAEGVTVGRARPHAIEPRPRETECAIRSEQTRYRRGCRRTCRRT